MASPIDVADADLVDLRDRLARTRWPEAETVDDWSQGIPLTYARELCDYWGHEYDWRATEARLNAFGPHRTELDGLGIHFLHVRSPEPNALPLVMTHGWPGSIVEFHKVIGPLTDPVAYGADAVDAFHVVCPSLPGYGWSDRPNRAGWKVPRIARAWAELMTRLGYDRYGAQGGDWGASVTTSIGEQDPEHVMGIHLNMVIALPDPSMGEPDPRELDAIASFTHYQKHESGYSTQQSTRPQTLGYGLVDSPAGQAAFDRNIPSYGRAKGSADAAAHPEEHIGRRRAQPPALGNDTYGTCNPMGMPRAILYPDPVEFIALPATDWPR